MITYGDGANRRFLYEYNLKDHLGNNRVTFMGTSLGGAIDVAQTTNYYPFGLVMNQGGNTKPTNQKNKYLYNGKELQDDKMTAEALNLYDYGARFYDPQIGRWTTIDPSIEDNHHEWTPYAYVYNNPLKFIDPFGLDTFLVNNRGKFAEQSLPGGDNDVIVKVSNKERRKGKINYNKEHKVSGNFEKGSIGVNTDKDSGNTLITSTNNNETEEIFNFLADNTKVEYSYMNMTDKEGKEANFITTSHQWDTDSYGNEFLDDQFKSNQGWSVTAHTHNHSQIDNPVPGFDYSKPSTGVNRGPNDVQFYRILKRFNGGNSFDIRIRYEGQTKKFDINGNPIK